MTTRQEPQNAIPVSRPVLYGLLVGAFVAAASTAGVGAGLLTRAGMDSALSRAIAFIAIPLFLYPILRARAAMRGAAFPTPFWKWMLIWTVLMFVSYAFVEPVIRRALS